MIGARSPRTRTRRSTPRCRSTRPRSARSCPGARTRRSRSRSTRRCRIRSRSRIRPSGTPPGGRSPTWPSSRNRDPRHPAGHDLHRVLHELADRRSAGGGRIVGGRTVAPGLRALVVPGSVAGGEGRAGGLDRIFVAAGFEWRGAGCSMCLGMNPDILQPGERSASTSNRNFEGRQGKGGRTHLVSPAVAAATAIAGRFTTPEDIGGDR